jgi:hypothetical protein
VIGTKDGEWVRLERDRDRRSLRLPRSLDDGLQDPAVAQVDAVEVADRDDPAARQVRGAERVADDVEGRQTTAPTTS